jgi:hypothetical protein
MKRQEKRRIEREKSKDSVKYTLSYNNMKEMTKKVIEAETAQIIEEARRQAITDLFAIVSESLHDEFGFGHDRLTRLFSRTVEKFDCINKGLVTIDDIVTETKKYFKFEFRRD